MDFFGVTILSFFLLFSFALLFVIASTCIGFIYTNIPFIKSKKEDFEFVIRDLGINRSALIYELGSGDGHIAFHAEKLTGAKVKGFEATLWPYLVSLIKKKIKNSKAEFVFGNFFKANWSEATVIYFYLYPPIMPKVVAKIKSECKPGTVIISHDFPLSNLGEEKYYPFLKPHGIYVYRI